MEAIKLENVSFNKLKEFTSLGNKKNITIKGKFTLIGEYELITKDGGNSMTTNQLAKIMLEQFAKISARIDKLEKLVYDIVKINHLKMPKNKK